MALGTAVAPRHPNLLAWTAGLVLLTAAAAGAQDMAPEPPSRVEAGVETDFGSVYLFRGLVYSAGAVTQSKVWLASGALNVYGWTNVAVPAAPGARTLDEVDGGASYAMTLGALVLMPAIDVYIYRLSDAERAGDAASHTTEVSVALSYTRGATTVSSKHIVDAGSYRGAYFAQVGVSHARALGARTTVEGGALAGWAARRFTRSYFGPDVSGVALASASVALTHRIGRGVYLRPHVEVSVIPEGHLRAAVSRGVNVAVGLAVGIVR